ncbi:hypothetical protein BVC80_8027g4 [Macleaya cordata]|uniref:Uncharacterized protein n=1 Tax=Macleaya cordata TaxID=56857 RepID=A0A200QMT0_MACCD|nr:hypothetical protein BVC80_8027g4 [Macleaya cordata]
MGEVLRLTRAAEVWQALATAFSSSCIPQELQLREDLQPLRRGSSTVVEHARKFCTGCEALSVIGRPVSEPEKVFLFLKGLGSDLNRLLQWFLPDHLCLLFMSWLSLLNCTNFCCDPFALHHQHGRALMFLNRLDLINGFLAFVVVMVVVTTIITLPVIKVIIFRV